MIGDSPPASTEDSCAPRDAPLYRTLVPNSSERKAACGAYIAACEQMKGKITRSKTTGGGPRWDPAEKIDGLAANPVRQRTKERDHWQFEGRGDQNPVQDDAAVHVNDLGGVD